MAVKKILFLEWECNVKHFINNKKGNSAEISLNFKKKKTKLLSPSNLVPRNPQLTTNRRPNRRIILVRPIGDFFIDKSYEKSSCENKGAKRGEWRKNDGEIFRRFFIPYCDDGRGHVYIIIYY